MMKGMSSIFDRKKGEFDLSLAHACHHFSLKYHRPSQTFRRDVPTTKRQIVTLEVKNLRNNGKNINNF